jgi:predicted lipoprotein
LKQGVTYDGVLDMHLDADMKTLGLWKGLCFHMNAFQIHGRSITADNIGALMPVSNPVARAEADHAAIARAALTEVIRPGYAAFGDATSALSEKVEALCKQPSDAKLKEAKDAFAAAVDAWNKVEIYRFGPVMEQHRIDHLFYWPDPKSLGLKQVQDALARKDETVAAPGTLAAKSVALHGLPALEYLLYGEGADALAEGDDDAAFRCKFAATVRRCPPTAWPDGPTARLSPKCFSTQRRTIPPITPPKR